MKLDTPYRKIPRWVLPWLPDRSLGNADRADRALGSAPQQALVSTQILSRIQDPKRTKVLLSAGLLRGHRAAGNADAGRKVPVGSLDLLRRPGVKTYIATLKIPSHPLTTVLKIPRNPPIRVAEAGVIFVSFWNARTVSAFAEASTFQNEIETERSGPLVPAIHPAWVDRPSGIACC